MVFFFFFFFYNEEPLVYYQVTKLVNLQSSMVGCWSDMLNQAGHKRKMPQRQWSPFLYKWQVRPHPLNKEIKHVI
jgi:hypothetical protein